MGSIHQFCTAIGDPFGHRGSSNALTAGTLRLSIIDQILVLDVVPSADHEYNGVVEGSLILRHPEISKPQSPPSDHKLHSLTLPTWNVAILDRNSDTRPFLVALSSP